MPLNGDSGDKGGIAAAVNLETVKRHCRVDHDEDDELLLGYLEAAVEYAEKFQTKNYERTYVDGRRAASGTGGDEGEASTVEEMSWTTRQAVLMMVNYWYDNRDLSWTNTANISQMTSQDRTMQAVHNLLYFDRTVRI